MMNKQDKKWNMQYEKLVEFKRNFGHCRVPKIYEQDKSLGLWVSHQRTFHNNNKLRLDRKRILEDLGFAWNDGAHKINQNDKLWHHQYEKLVKFKRKLSLIHIPSPRDRQKSRMPSSA